MTEAPNIQTGVAYARTGPAGGTTIRFVVAVGKDAAPVGHKLHDQPAVKFRRVSKMTVHAPQYLTVSAFKTWLSAAYKDHEATEKARDHLGYRCEGL